MAFSVVGFGYKVQFGKETFRQNVVFAQMFLRTLQIEMI